MDMSQAWLAEMEMEDPGFMSYDQMSILSDVVNNFSVDSFYSEIYAETTTCVDKTFQTQQPEIRQETSSSISKSSAPLDPLVTNSLPSSKTFTISFGDLEPKEETLQFDDSLGYEDARTTKVSITLRNPIQAQDHVFAERRRREKLNQNFISLSTVLPSLKKMDKASMLEDAFNYIKELQGRVKELEGTLKPDNKRENVDQESDISLKRYKLSNPCDKTRSEKSTSPCNTSPEIKVSISGSSVTVTIQCQNNSSSFVKALTQMQKLGLSIIYSSAMPFVTTILLITIVAQIVDDFSMTPTELAKSLQLAI
ncbi:Myc-type, basic helix-loop-helix (bHLH) domain-containing protein [Artemisia annua]|uniref:Myc-type, basic helix-loop-helix (BHLH) domain-containing protein n=1 Tax=Artemisia annua TaxID=35608 RepID=A0A2U1MBP5_ARTAN|nr:Myc-type, basic helix-loop-helix (bHLH) domain-containing protein [Artemisia annua]